MTKEDLIKEIKEDCSYDSNYDYYIMTEQDISILADELLKKINYTRCCKSDSEQLSKGIRTSKECDNTEYPEKTYTGYRS